MYKKLLMFTTTLMMLLSVASYASEVKTGSLIGDEETTEYETANNETQPIESTEVVSQPTESPTPPANVVLDNEINIIVEDGEVIDDSPIDDSPDNNQEMAPPETIWTGYFKYGVKNETSEIGIMHGRIDFTVTGEVGENQNFWVQETFRFGDNLEYKFTKISETHYTIDLEERRTTANNKEGYKLRFSLPYGSYSINGRFRVVMTREGSVFDDDPFLLAENNRSNILSTGEDQEDVQYAENTIFHVVVNSSTYDIPYGETILDKLLILPDKELEVFNGYEMNGVKLTEAEVAMAPISVSPLYKSKMILPGPQFNEVIKQLIADSGFTDKLVTFRTTTSQYDTIVSSNPNAKFYDVSEAQDRSTLMCKELGGGMDICIFSIYKDIYFNTNCMDMFNGVSQIKTFQSDWTTDKKFKTDHVTDMAGMFNDCANITSFRFSKFSTASCKDMSRMFNDCLKLTSIDVSSFDTSNVTLMDHMFAHCSELASLDLSNFNTSKVETMEGMFTEDWKLASVNISSFTSESLKTTYEMFENCKLLTTLSFNKAFTCSNVESMFEMFAGCNKLDYLDLRYFRTQNVNSFKYMFHNCDALVRLDYYTSNFNTDSATDLYGMFAGCGMLYNIDVSKFKTGNVTDMGEMFNGCLAMTEINCANWDVRRVTNFYNIFNYTINCSSINVTGWNTQSAENMNRMFCCSGITSIDVSSFDTRNVKVFDLMFSTYGGAGKEITSITYGSLFLPTSGTSFSKMFYGCVANKPVKQQWTGTWSSDGTYSL